jgi:hypothetical protein
MLQDFKSWVILILIGLVAFAYLNPDMFKSSGDAIVDKANSIMGNAPIDRTNEQLQSSCPLTSNPVCGADNVTYTNSCLANLAQVDYTSGVCR